MSVDYSPWPHLDVAGLPEPLRKFLLFTIAASLYMGVVFVVVVMATATSELISALLESGITELSSVIAGLGNLFSDVTAPT
ncbi:MAG: hypothetical protein O6942_07435 [Bacteroidetes bacterium]|nr:hypothetical protein [Bacteroidota bacterium]